jgi:hypothetical protein
MNDDVVAPLAMATDLPFPGDEPPTVTRPQTPALVRTPRPESFRPSQVWLAGQIARAVARGQRVL